MTLITFDDITNAGQGIMMPNNYFGLNWSNMYATNGTTVVNVYGPNGYTNGLVSVNNDAYNGYGSPASIIAQSTTATFNLNSGYFTAAWNNNLNLNVKAYNSNNNVLYEQNYVLQTTGPLLITFNWPNIYKVTFSTSGGTRAWGSSGYQFALDNLTINDQIVPLSIPSKLRQQTLNPNTNISSIKVGQTYQLSPSVSSGLMYFLYKSSNDKVATVDKNGLIKAISKGKFNVQIYQPGNEIFEPINYFLPWFIEVVE